MTVTPTNRTLDFSTIHVRFIAPFDTPYFIGSQIRGAMGYALKKVVCINPSQQCEGCFAADHCLYFQWYEQKGGYHAYRLDIELGKGYYDFSLLLFGDATSRLPYVISALQRLLSVHGLGKERHKIERYEMSLNGTDILQGGKVTLPQQTLQTFVLPETTPPKRLKITFVTPLRIKYRNRFVRNIAHLPLPTLIASIDARWKQLCGEAPSKLAHRVEGEIVDRFGTFKDLTRYSGRQRGHLKIGGLLGEMTVEGIDAQSYALLQAAELIGAGKQTVFGLGKLKVEELDRI